MSTPSLLPILKDIATHLIALQEVLNNEYQALADNDASAIEKAARDKIRLTELLDDLEKERVTLLRNAGLDLGRTGVMAYLSRHHQTGPNAIANLWQQIEQLSQDCEQQNRINGIVVEQNRRRAETALNILRGQVADTELYSASGNTVSSAERQSITTKA